MCHKINGVSKWSYLWNRNSLTDIENRLVVPKGQAGGGGMEWEIGIGDVNYYI